MDLNGPEIKASQSQEAVPEVSKETKVNTKAKDSPKKKKKVKKKNEMKGVKVNITVEGNKVLAATTNNNVQVQKIEEKSNIVNENEDTVNFAKKKKFKDKKKRKSKSIETKKLKSEASMEDLQLFTLDDISKNSQASTLISDLVNCFMTGSSVEKSEAKSVRDFLYKQAVKVFLDVLNSSVEKIMKKLLEKDFLEKLLEKKVTKLDASCQTDC